MNTKEPMYKNDFQTICHKICYQHQCVSSLAYHRRESTDYRVQLWKGELEQVVEGNHGRCPMDGYSRVWVTRGSMEEYSKTFQKRKPQKNICGGTKHQLFFWGFSVLTGPPSIFACSHFCLQSPPKDNHQFYGLSTG